MTDAPNSQSGTLWQAVKCILRPTVPPPPDLPPPNPKAFAIKEVIAREAQQIRALCADRDVRDRLNPIPPPGEKTPIQAAAPEHLGVAFSGGGIRSASVNLGLIQALARSGFLRQAHYISGVSGGGYILGWLTGWTARVGFDKVESQLSADSASPGLDLPARAGFRRYLEPNPIHFLRRYVSFLVPRSGISSGDTLAAAAMYLRNLLLNQALLAATLLGIFALLQMAAPALIWRRLIDGYGVTLISFCSRFSWRWGPSPPGPPSACSPAIGLHTNANAGLPLRAAAASRCASASGCFSPTTSGTTPLRGGHCWLLPAGLPRSFSPSCSCCSSKLPASTH